jgi:fatty-acyl-CoA synthase
VSDLEPILELARPRTLRKFWRAGAFGIRSAAGLVTSLPWLIGRGPSLGIITRLNARAVGAKPAIHDRHGTVTWADLDRRTNQVARLLAARGLHPGDRVATLLHNGREAVEVIIGAQKLGIVACPINTWAKPDELRSILDQAEPKLLFYDVRHGDQLEPVRSEDLGLVMIGELQGPEGADPYDTALDSHSVAPLTPFTRDRGSAQIVIHTSGTTGKPKGASRAAGGRGMREFAGLIEVVPLHRDDVILCPAPLFHAFGMLAFTLGTLLGSTLVLPDRFDPQEALDLIQPHRVTACAMVPVMLRRIVSLPGLKRYDLGSVRIILASGSALSQDLRERVADVFGDVLYDLYGSTEAGWVAIATPEDIRGRPGTVGRPVPGVELAAFSPQGERLPAGETGELHARSGARFEGYLDDAEAEEREGFLALGDMGWVDEDGYLHVEGRGDDMVVIGGENVYPIEVEETITKLDGVSDVAVLGVEDEEYGHVLAAFYEGSADPEAIEKACREALASFKVPRRVERVDSLPRTATGKVLKRDLLELDADRASDRGREKE